MPENKTTYGVELKADSSEVDELTSAIAVFEQKTEGAEAAVAGMAAAAQDVGGTATEAVVSIGNAMGDVVGVGGTAADAVVGVGNAADAATESMDDMGASSAGAASQVEKSSSNIHASMLAAGAAYSRGAREAQTANQKVSTSASAASQTILAAAARYNNGLQAQSKAVAKASTDFTKLGSQMSAAFQKAGGSAKAFGASFKTAFAASFTQTKSLTASVKSGLAAGFDTVKGKVAGAGAAAKTFGSALLTAVKNPVGTIKSTLTGAIENMVAKMQSAKDKTDETGESMQDMGDKGESAASKVLGALGKLVAIGLVVAAVKKATGAIKDFAQQSVEAFTGFETAAAGVDSVFADSDAVKQWADDFGTAAGRSKTEILGFLSTSKGMMDNFGVSGEAAEEMSKAMTGLTYDIAAAKKMSDTDAFELMKSAMQGDAIAAGQLGLNLSETTLKAEAAAMGFRKEYSELTAAEQAQVRMNAVLAQTSDIHGKVIDGQEGLANAQKRVTATLENAKVAVGQKLAPVMEKFLGLFETLWPKVEPIIMQLADMLANELSGCIPVIAAIAEDLLPTLMEAFGGLMGALMPLVPIFLQMAADLLPILASILASVMAALAPLLPVFAELAQAVLPPLVNVIGLITETVLPPLVDIFNLIVGSVLPPLIDIFMVLLETVITPIMPLIQELAETIVPPLAEILGMLAETVLPPLVNIFMLLIDDVLMPLMPVIQVLITALLPPLAQIFALIGQVLQAASPIITFVGEALGFVGEVIGNIIGFAADGVGKVVGFFSSIFGGAKDAKGATDELGESVEKIGDAAGAETKITVNSDIKTPEPPPMPEFDPIVIESELNTDTTNTSIDEMLANAGTKVPETFAKVEGDATKSVDAINKATDDSKTQQVRAMDEIGSAASSTYTSMGSDAARGWNEAAEASETGTMRILASIAKINAASQSMAKPTTGSVPQYAEGTENHPGGLAIVGEQGPELVTLPAGSKVTPSDKTSEMLTPSAVGNVLPFVRKPDESGSDTAAPQKESKRRGRRPEVKVEVNVNIQVNGNLDESVVPQIVDQLKAIAEEAAEQAVDRALEEEATDMIIQEGA